MRWVTGRRPHVDRCASAWFIRRFVDRKAAFLFAGPGDAVPRGATPFDLPSAALGHHAAKDTFDALLTKYRTRYPQKDRALASMSDLVRDRDLAEFQSPESRGLGMLLYGLLPAEPNDQRVLLNTEPILEGIYQYYHGDQGH